MYSTVHRFITADYQKKKPEIQPDWSWFCGFESFTNTMCNIQQDQGDDFDFTRWIRSTPSELTGPSQAHEGSYYIYIEASNPRKPGDRAT